MFPLNDNFKVDDDTTKVLIIDGEIFVIVIIFPILILCFVRKEGDSASGRYIPNSYMNTLTTKH